jgi:hypothetical protein
VIVAAIATLALVPLVAIRPDFVSSSASGIGSMFLPPQLLWWVGKNSWVAQWAHVLIVAVALAAVLAWVWLRRRRGEAAAPTAQEALLLLAFVFMLRAALDPWNNVYYAIPFLFALLAYEVCSGRPPFLMLSCAVLLWIAPQIPRTAISADMRALIYAAIAAPILVVLAGRLYAPRAASRLRIRTGPGAAPDSGDRLALAGGRAPA